MIGRKSPWTPLQLALNNAEAGWWLAAIEKRCKTRPFPEQIAIASDLMETAIRDLPAGKLGRLYRGVDVIVDAALPSRTVEARGDGVTYRSHVNPE